MSDGGGGDFTVLFVQTKDKQALISFFEELSWHCHAVPIANVSVERNMTPSIITIGLFLLFAPSYGKRCSSKTSDIVKITVRNETRKEAGKDPVEEVIELKMWVNMPKNGSKQLFRCNGMTHLVDLKEEVIRFLFDPLSFPLETHSWKCWRSRAGRGG